MEFFNLLQSTISSNNNSDSESGSDSNSNVKNSNNIIAIFCALFRAFESVPEAQTLGKDQLRRFVSFYRHVESIYCKLEQLLLVTPLIPTCKQLVCYLKNQMYWRKQEIMKDIMMTNPEQAEFFKLFDCETEIPDDILEILDTVFITRTSLKDMKKEIDFSSFGYQVVNVNLCFSQFEFANFFNFSFESLGDFEDKNSGFIISISTPEIRQIEASFIANLYDKKKKTIDQLMPGIEELLLKLVSYDFISLLIIGIWLGTGQIDEKTSEMLASILRKQKKANRESQTIVNVCARGLIEEMQVYIKFLESQRDRFQPPNRIVELLIEVINSVEEGDISIIKLKELTIAKFGNGKIVQIAIQIIEIFVQKNNDGQSKSLFDCFSSMINPFTSEQSINLNSCFDNKEEKELHNGAIAESDSVSESGSEWESKSEGQQQQEGLGNEWDDEEKEEEEQQQEQQEQYEKLQNNRT